VSLTQGRRRQEFGVWTAVGAKRLATLPIHVDISEYLAFLFKKDSLFILHIIKVSRWGSSLDIVQKKNSCKSWDFFGELRDYSCSKYKCFLLMTMWLQCCRCGIAVEMEEGTEIPIAHSNLSLVLS
jgi:hypothetical protein